MAGIGRLNETELHEQLKHRYAESRGRTEVEVEGFVVDVVLPEELVEIQTRGLGKMRRKIVALRDRHRLRIVHPIASETLITKLSDGGELLSSRRSPRRGRPEEVFRELTSIADLLPHPNVTVEVVLVRTVETRRADGKGSWRRHGVSVIARALGAIDGTIRLTTAHDYLALLPRDLPARFCNSDVMAAGAFRYAVAQPMTSALRKMGLLSLVDKRGREGVYEIAQVDGARQATGRPISPLHPAPDSR